MTSAPLPSVPRVGHHHHESFAAPAALNPIVWRSRRPKVLCSGSVLAPLPASRTRNHLIWMASDDSNPVRCISFGEDQVKAGPFAAGVAGWSTQPRHRSTLAPDHEGTRNFAQVLASVLPAGRRW